MGRVVATAGGRGAEGGGGVGDEGAGVTGCGGGWVLRPANAKGRYEGGFREVQSLGGCSCNGWGGLQGEAVGWSMKWLVMLGNNIQVRGRLRAVSSAITVHTLLECAPCNRKYETMQQNT